MVSTGGREFFLLTFANTLSAEEDLYGAFRRGYELLVQNERSEGARVAFPFFSFFSFVGRCCCGSRDRQLVLCSSVSSHQRWCNEFLKRRGIQINDLFHDLQDGLVLISLLEILTHPKTVGRHNAKPRIAVAKIENLSIALRFLQAEGVVLVNIGAEDIHAGNSNIILVRIQRLSVFQQLIKSQRASFGR